MRSGVSDPGALSLTFVPTFGTLVAFGPLAMVLAAVATSGGRMFVKPRQAPRMRDVLQELTGVLIASVLAGAAYGYVSDAMPAPLWPWRAVPAFVAVLAFCVVTAGLSDFVVPLLSRAPRVPRSLLRGVPAHIVGGAVAVAVVEIATERAWLLLPVVAVPLFFGWRLYSEQLEQAAARQRHREAAETSDEAMALVDGAGRLVMWNAAAERLLGVSEADVLRRSVAEAVPALASTDVPAAVAEALRDRRARTIQQVSLQAQGGTRTLQATLMPDTDGVMLFLRDATEQARAEQSLRQSAERLAGVGAGASDGLWDWDERAQLLYRSARWNDMVGLPAVESLGSRSDWFGRVHPDDLPALSAAIDAHASGKTPLLLHEHRVRHEDGSYRRMQCRAVAARDGRGRTLRIAGSLTDVSDSALARMLGGGPRDSLTGLTSRASFVERLGERLQDLRQRGGSRFAVLYLDLDRFKVVNDSLGHLAGDELLVAVSRRLEGSLRPDDAFARLGGDEFAILVHGIGDATQANVIAFRIQESFAAPFPIAGRDVVVSASIGIAFSRPEYVNPEEIMRDADTAMYQAKARGKARHELFDADMHARALDRLVLEDDLRRAVKASDFEVHYQPIVSLSSRRCVGFESLVRWTRNGKPVSPAEFIPLAEELGIVAPLGTWVLQQACRQFVDWQRRHPTSGLECITVNVSTRQLMQQGFPYLIEETLQRTAIKPADLRIEITETALMDSPQQAAQVLTELRELGVKIYLDDFGTGYSSLSHLHKLPVDALKIDRSFVRTLLLDERPAMVESILALARTLETSVVAEGIEDERQARELERLGCTHAQGFYFSRPISAGAVETLLVNGQPLGATPGLRAAVTAA